MRGLRRRLDNDLRRRELLLLPCLQERMGPGRQRLRVPSGPGLFLVCGSVPQRQRPELRDWSRLRQQRVFFPAQRRLRIVLQLVRGRFQLRPEADLRVQPECLRPRRRAAVHQVRPGLDRAAPGIVEVLVPVALGLRVESGDQHLRLSYRHTGSQRSLPFSQRAGVHSRRDLRFGTLQRRRLRPIVSLWLRSVGGDMRVSSRADEVWLELCRHQNIQ